MPRKSIVRSTELLISLQTMAAVGHVIKIYMHLVIMCGRESPMDVSHRGLLLKKQVGSLLLGARTVSGLTAINTRRRFNEYHRSNKTTNSSGRDC